jgi:hypothetical protein
MEGGADLLEEKLSKVAAILTCYARDQRDLTPTGASTFTRSHTITTAS